jgi:hypothetical protein
LPRRPRAPASGTSPSRRPTTLRTLIRSTAASPRDRACASCSLVGRCLPACLCHCLPACLPTLHSGHSLQLGPHPPRRRLPHHLPPVWHRLLGRHHPAVHRAVQQRRDDVRHGRAGRARAHHQGRAGAVADGEADRAREAHRHHVMMVGIVLLDGSPWRKSVITLVGRRAIVVAC